MQFESVIDQDIKKVCPIDGISFGKRDDKKTWRIDFAKEATDEQKKLAQEVLDKFEWNDAKQEESRKYYRDEDMRGNLLCKCAFLIYKEKNPDAKLGDFLEYLEKANW